MAVTAQQQRELAAIARRANRRIERASEGQREAFRYFIRNYHTRTRDDGTIVFTQGKAGSEAEYQSRMKELERFLEAESTTIKGWNRLKQQNVTRAGKTIRNQGFNLTDKELKVILQELPAKSSKAAFYKALENVEIYKDSRKNQTKEPTPEQIKKAMKSRRTDQQRTEALLKLREKRKT